MIHYVGLALLGVFIGAFGTLIGAGGGFILTPVLVLLYPHESPAVITGISLAVVFFNATAGSISYARMKRIDFGSALRFAAASVPGAILGALATSLMTRRVFDLVFGSLMLVAAVAIGLLGTRAAKPGHHARARGFARDITDSTGTRYVYSYPLGAGLAISFGVGFMSSLLGIGGGIVHVPAMVHFLDFPVHIATATSHFVLSGMSLAGTVVHVVTGAFNHGIRRTAALAVGVLIGAPIGARFSKHVGETWILRGLAVALFAVGARILWVALR